MDTNLTHPSFGKPMGATCETLADAIAQSIETGEAATLDYSEALHSQAADECEDIRETADAVELRGINLDGERWSVRLVR